MHGSGGAGADSGGDGDDAGAHQTPIVGMLWEARRKAPARAAAPLEPDADGEGWVRPPQRLDVVYDFSSNTALRSTYRNAWGTIRVGRVLEDLDALAGSVAAAHCKDASGTLPEWLLLVTASVDRVTVQRQHSNIAADMTLSGVVTYVGSSSVEILMKATSAGAKHPWISATFTFVARDTRTNTASRVNRLRPEIAEEVRAWEQGAARAEAKKLMRLQKGAKHPDPSSKFADLPGYVSDPKAYAAEQLEQAQVLLRMPSLAPPNAILMRDTRLSNAMICQPQQRNTSGRVFGGFLMRRAFELAFSTAYLFIGAKPHFVEVDEVVFSRPVDVGNLLQLSSRVLYTRHFEGQGHISVEVIAYVTKPEERSSMRTNTFSFTFTADDGVELRKVLPATRSEASRSVERLNADVVQSHLHRHYDDTEAAYVWPEAEAGV